MVRLALRVWWRRRPLNNTANLSPTSSEAVAAIIHGPADDDNNNDDDARSQHSAFSVAGDIAHCSTPLRLVAVLLEGVCLIFYAMTEKLLCQSGGRRRRGTR